MPRGSYAALGFRHSAIICIALASYLCLLEFVSHHVAECAPGVQAMEAEKVVQANIAKLLRLTDNSKAELPKDVEVKVWEVWMQCRGVDSVVWETLHCTCAGGNSVF